MVVALSDVFRLHDADWICVEMGEKSSFAICSGDKWARSSKGLSIMALLGGTRFGRLLSQPLDDISLTHGLKLDQVYTYLARDETGDPEPISYQRLLMGAHFPDGSFALAAVIERTRNFIISGLHCKPEDQMIQN